MPPPLPSPLPRRPGRPAREGTYKTTLHLSPPTKAALMAEAARRRVTLGEVVALAIERMLGGEERAA